MGHEDQVGKAKMYTLINAIIPGQNEESETCAVKGGEETDCHRHRISNCYF
jgi:hypothetical protein